MHQRLLSMGFTTTDRKVYKNVCLGITVTLANGCIDTVLKGDAPVPSVLNIAQLIDFMLKEVDAYGD